MENETQKIIAEQMKILPKDVISAIVSVDYKTKLQEITERQRLLIDQAGKLEMETTLVMIGLEPLRDYVGNLARELEMPSTRAQEIAQDVNDNIFKPIRDSLRKIEDDMGQADISLRTAEGVAPEDDGGVEIEKTVQPEKAATDSDNRAQILNEIENPHLIGRVVAENPKREIEAFGEIPADTVSDIVPEEITPTRTEAPANRLGVLETKMAGITITPQTVVEAEPEIKLPAVEKKRPTSGIDPYREPTI